MLDLFLMQLKMTIAIMSGAYVVSRLIKNPTVVDVCWGLGIAAVVTYMAQFYTTADRYQWGMLIMVLFWSFRLSGFLFWTRVARSHVDRRYQRLQDKWGRLKEVKTVLNFYFQGFLQAVLCMSFWPVLWATDYYIRPIHWIAIGLFVLALLGQWVADYQLHQFKLTGQSGFCQHGLWSRSRHPNYFFEILMWISWALYSLTTPLWMFGWIGPLVMIMIMRGMTGPYSERLSVEKYGQAYQAYQQRVPMIFISLLPPRSNV